MGNYWSPLADLYWSSTRDRLKTYGISLNHRSSWGKLAKLPEYGPVQQGLTDVTLFGKYILGEALQLSSDLSYQHDHNLYYGFTDSTLQAVLGQTRDNISLADYRASYNIATWNIGVKNMELDANKLGYAANVHLSDLWSVYGQNELNFNLSGDIHYGFNIKNLYKGIAYLHAEWDFYRNEMPNTMPLGYNVTPMPTLGSNGSIVKVNPYIDYLFRGLQFRTGLVVGWDGYAANSVGSAFRVFPDVTVSKKFLKDKLVLSLAAKGGMDAVSLNVLRQINPYLVPDYTPAATYHYDFIFHTRWTFSRKLEANAEVSYSLVDGDPVFHLSPAFGLNNVYEPIFLSDNRLTAGGDFTFVNDEMITLRAGGHYYHWCRHPRGRPCPALPSRLGCPPCRRRELSQQVVLPPRRAAPRQGDGRWRSGTTYALWHQRQSRIPSQPCTLLLRRIRQPRLPTLLLLGQLPLPARPLPRRSDVYNPTQIMHLS